MASVGPVQGDVNQGHRGPRVRREVGREDESAHKGFWLTILRILIPIKAEGVFFNRELSRGKQINARKFKQNRENFR